MFQALQNRPGLRVPVNRWWIVAGMGLAVFMASLDMSVVSLALPEIRRRRRSGSSSGTCSRW